jgi:cytosine/adenosine deaminase-related metal-dependent hydrolase
MIDTHRHMWQTAMRGYGADWTLTQYFVYYYLENGKHFRPEDIHAGNLLAAAEAIDAGVHTCVDWSHGLQTDDHADAAVDALQAIPGRFVLAYGNIQQPPWSGRPAPEFRDFVSRRITGDDMLGFQMAFDIPATRASRSRRPSRWPATSACPVPRTPASGGDQRRRHPADARARLHDAESIYVHAGDATEDSYQRIAAPVARCRWRPRASRAPGQGYPPTWAIRKHGIPISLSMDTSVWWSGDLFTRMRSTLGRTVSGEHWRRTATATR